jgi:hypothetical protein
MKARRGCAMDAAGFDPDYPRIAARAEAREGSIHWGDETGVRDQDQIAPSARAQEVAMIYSDWATATKP